MANGFAPGSLPLSNPLSAVLNRVCFSGWQAGVGAFSGHWAVDVPTGFVSFYVVAQGCCRLILQHEATAHVDMRAGDYVLLTHDTSHRICDQADSPPVRWHDAFFDLERESMFTPLSDDATTIVCGYMPAQPLGREPLAGILPETMHMNTADHSLLAEVQPVLEMASQQHRRARPGWHPVTSRMIQVLLLQAVRTYVLARLETEDAHGRAHWLSAATDGSIGPVLAQLHEAPERRWTVRSLARQAHMAKSAFSQRFRDTVGRPPLQYLTAYRMERACELLLDTTLGVKEIAASVGYDSASSFSNAFKRWRGQAPAIYRRNGLHGRTSDSALR